MTWTLKIARAIPGGTPLRGVIRIEAPSLSNAINQAAGVIRLTDGFSITNR